MSYRKTLFTMTLALLAGVPLAPCGVRADTFFVGSGTGCTTLASAILGAAISPGGDTILIAENLTWTGATALALENEAPVTIRGAASCSDGTAVRRDITMINGDLFEFIDTFATLRDLRLISDTGGGRPLTAEGGDSTIILEADTFLIGGKANSGGNAHLSDGASLVTLAGAVITGGEALFNGGGIYCSGAGTAGIGVGSRVVENEAEFDGGGVYATSGCTVNVLAGGPVPASPGEHYGVVDNVAGFNGGGIYATSGATLNVVGTSSTPASIRLNLADFNGGGIYLTDSGTVGNLLSSEVVGNIGSRRGGGVYVTSGAELLMERDLAECARGIECSLLESNTTLALSGETTLGGAIAVTGGGSARIRQSYVTDNSANNGAAVALVEGTDSFLLLEGDVFYDNLRRGSHILARNGGHAVVAFSSAWGSSTSGFGMYFMQAGDNGTTDLYSSVVVEGNGQDPTGGGTDKVFGPPGSGAAGIADCVIAHETGTMPSGGGALTVETDPATLWLDPASGDPHLRADSPAIDYCDTALYTPVDDDIDGEARGADAPVADLFGPYDLGADEWYPGSSSEIFADGFESGDTTAWTSTTP